MRSTRMTSMSTSPWPRFSTEHGLDATTEDFGAFFREAGYSLWHANLAARRALRRGVPATESGTPRYNVHANDIDFQIEADFIGLMTPGMPRASNDFCERAGRVMNHGDGLYGGMFVSAMYCCGVLRERSTANRRSRAGGPAAGEPLRAGDLRRSRWSASIPTTGSVSGS